MHDAVWEVSIAVGEQARLTAVMLDAGTEIVPLLGPPPQPVRHSVNAKQAATIRICLTLDRFINSFVAVDISNSAMSTIKKVRSDVIGGLLRAV